MCRKQKFSCNKNKKPLTVHNKEKQINQKVFKLIYIQWFFVVVYLLTVGIENKGRALTTSSYFIPQQKIFANLYSAKPNESDNFKKLNI